MPGHWELDNDDDDDDDDGDGEEILISAMSIHLVVACYTQGLVSVSAPFCFVANNTKKAEGESDGWIGRGRMERKQAERTWQAGRLADLDVLLLIYLIASLPPSQLLSVRILLDPLILSGV